MGFAEYLLKVSVSVLVIWAVHRMVFRKLTFFHWNRIFLLVSLVCALMLPLVRIAPMEGLVAAADIPGFDWSSAGQFHPYSDSAEGREAPSAWPSILLPLLYGLGCLGAGFRLWRRFRLLRKQISDARPLVRGRLSIFILPPGRDSFSLFRNIYLASDHWGSEREYVLRHEQVHAIQLHSLDLLLMDLMAVIWWFNPFIYLLKRSIRENHEFLADEPASRSREALSEYLLGLRNETHGTMYPAAVNYFNSSTLKKRIMMLSKQPTHKRKKWYYGIVAPLLVLMLLAFQAPRVEDASETAHSGFGFPLPEDYRGKVSWGFGEQAADPVSKKDRTHFGVDIPAPTGTPVYASADGIVEHAESKGGWGRLIVITHPDGFTSYYAHLDKFSVESGDRVKKGDELGEVGTSGRSTGPHLHFELRKDGKHMNPAHYY